MSLLAQITARHMCAGFVMVNNIVIDTAPILRYMRGWTHNRVKSYCASKGWHVRVVRVEGE